MQKDTVSLCLEFKNKKQKSKEHQREVEKVLATPEVVVEARAEKPKLSRQQNL